MRKYLLAVWVCVFSLFVFAPSSSFAIDCDTVPPRPAIEFDSIGTFQFNGGASCWGWIAPNGEEYAIMGSGDGIDVVRISTMTHVGHAPMQSCDWRELKTYRNYCYVVSECDAAPNAGMMIVDLQYLPDSLHVVGAYTGNGVRSHCISIDTARGFAYLVRTSYNGFRIVDLVNPEAPNDTATVALPDLHDMTAFNDTVYAAEGGSSSFSIWNCTNKLSPVMLARVSIPGGGYVHNLWPTDDRRFVVSTEELPDFRTMKVWNIENLSNIYMVDEYLGPGGIPHNAHIEDNHLYLSHYSSGVSVLDVTYPECTDEVALFDTYLPSNSAIFDGCWGVFPHTAGRQTVYASNIDGRLFILKTNVVSTKFSGTPLLGAAPLNVSFTDASPIANSWAWQFGDGGVSSSQNPSHVYGPGLYTVQLDVTKSSDVGIERKPNYVTALAETLKVADTVGAPNSSMVWEVRYRNYVPLTEIKLPIQLSNVPPLAIFDSISTVGCRTSYFESQQYVLGGPGSNKAAFQMFADNGGGSPGLAPGDGPIAKVFWRITGAAQPGQQITMTMPPMGVSQHSLGAATYTTTYVPALVGGTTTVANLCDCSCHGDPICDTQIDVLDVVTTIDVAFRNVAPTVDGSCPHVGRSDLDCSGSIDVIDVVLIVGVAFRNVDPQTSICDPCNP